MGIADRSNSGIELSIVMPCLNEARTLAACIQSAQKGLSALPITSEIIVADNGSTDGSQDIALEMGVVCVSVAEQGYGRALSGGIAAVRGEFVIMGDSDNSHDFTEISRFLPKLLEGYDLVVGNRYLGNIAPGAMPFFHRYLGNPVLSGMGRLFFRSPCRDFHCGMRAIRKSAFDKLQLRTTGMEFATEMIVKATLMGMRVCEVPSSMLPDGRGRAPHLRPWRDGWRHMRFLLLYSPRWLFLYPGAVLIVLGTLLGIWLFQGPRRLGDLTLDIRAFLYAAIAVLMGFQSVCFAVFTKIFAITEGLLPEDSQLNRLFHYITLEVGITIGSILVVAGLAASVFAAGVLGANSPGFLNQTGSLRVVIAATLALTLGFQVVLASFFLSVLGLRRK